MSLTLSGADAATWPMLAISRPICACGLCAEFSAVDPGLVVDPRLSCCPYQDRWDARINRITRIHHANQGRTAIRAAADRKLRWL